MITLTSKEGVTDVHVEGTRLNLAADAACIFNVAVSLFAEHTGMNRARALVYLTQEVLKYLSKDGNAE